MQEVAEGMKLNLAKEKTQYKDNMGVTRMRSNRVHILGLNPHVCIVRGELLRNRLNLTYQL